MFKYLIRPAGILSLIFLSVAIVLAASFTNSTPVEVDGSTAFQTVNVTGEGTIAMVTIDLTFLKTDGTCAVPNLAGTPWNDEIRFALQSPLGTTVVLIERVTYNIGSSGSGTVTVTLADGGAAFGSSPATGTFAPTQALSAFNGEVANGTWTLDISDDVFLDPLCISSWTLNITSTPPLAASASCNGDNLEVSITAGDANFDITGTGINLPTNNVGIGTHTLTGPGTWTGLTVTEISGDNETLILGSFTCPVPTIVEEIEVPPPPPCTFDNEQFLEIARGYQQPGTVPTGDVTCRIINVNGEFVTSTSEIGVQSVLDMGVLQAVDIFASQVDFNHPVEVCLLGTGSHIMYLNAKNIPRVGEAIPSHVQTIDGQTFTCTTISQAGTLALVGTTASSNTTDSTTSIEIIQLNSCRVTPFNILNFRDAPSLDGNVKSLIAPNIELEAIARTDDWFNVISGNDNGWISATFVNTGGICN